MTGLSDNPRHRGVIVVDTKLNAVLPWVEAFELSTKLDDGQRVHASAELLFPPRTRTDHASQRSRALRAMLEEDNASDKPAYEKWTAPLGHAFALGWAPTPNPDTPGLLVPKWNIATFKLPDARQLGVMLLDVTQTAEEGDSVEPFLLVDTEYGRGLERTIAAGLRRMQTQGATKFPYRHLLSLCFRSGRMLRDKDKVAAPSPAPQLKLHVPLAAAV
jgi:hypothetical protein